MLDLHSHLGDDHRPADPTLVRLLREISATFQSGTTARALIIVAPLLRIPPELEKDITLVDFPLPGETEIRSVLDGMIAANTSSDSRIRIEVDAVGRERLAKAALGLTLHEATNAFARAMVDDGVLRNEDVQIVLEEKKQTIRKSGLLEFVTVDIDLDDVGGLQNLKRWLIKRNNSWMDEAAEYGLPAPKGVLMTGVPGCGKSLTAKAIAAAWGLPLLRLDIGKVFAGIVGSSEQNMRQAIRSAEATAPCVLWLDEIEKGFSGVSGDGGDGGTSSRVFGSFLTWMQEKTAPVFVIATANKVDRLPPEFLRKGRFDEIFFVDLPTRAERRDRVGPPPGQAAQDEPCSRRGHHHRRPARPDGGRERRLLRSGNRASNRRGAVRRVRRAAQPERSGPVPRTDQHGSAQHHPGRTNRCCPRLGSEPGSRGDRNRRPFRIRIDRSGRCPHTLRANNHNPACRRHQQRARPWRKAGGLLVSIEIVLIPMAVAAVSAWQANRKIAEDGRELLAVSTRMKNADLLAQALTDLNATVQASPESITATWPALQARFARNADGVWTAHFSGEVTSETTATVVRDLDRAYGLRVQQAVLERVRASAPEAGMVVESETVEEDRTVTLVLNVGR